LLTVPLLVIALVLVLDMPARQARLRCLVLGLQAAEMILLGYPGQISTVTSTRWLWWGAAMVPFLIIVQQLYIGLADAVAAQPKEARGLVVAARFMMVLTWCFYPAVYILPLVGVTGSTSFIATQVGYAGADITAKAVYGLLIFMIAYRKTQIEREGSATDARPENRFDQRGARRAAA
jgi:bacteriorhodopsin